VVPGVVGSSPIFHPESKGSSTDEPFLYSVVLKQRKDKRPVPSKVEVSTIFHPDSNDSSPDGHYL
jgi:hypothetical protein